MAGVAKVDLDTDKNRSALPAHLLNLSRNLRQDTQQAAVPVKRWTDVCVYTELLRSPADSSRVALRLFDNVVGRFIMSIRMPSTEEQRLAELSDSMGTLVEDMVAMSAPRIASEVFPSDPVIRLAQRLRQVHSADPVRMVEMDLLAAGRAHQRVNLGQF